MRAAPTPARAFAHVTPPDGAPLHVSSEFAANVMRRLADEPDPKKPWPSGEEVSARLRKHFGRERHRVLRVAEISRNGPMSHLSRGERFERCRLVVSTKPVAKHPEEEGEA